MDLRVLIFQQERQKNKFKERLTSVSVASSVLMHCSMWIRDRISLAVNFEVVEECDSYD